MAIGFTPKAALAYELDGLRTEDALTLAVLTAEALNWTVIYLSEAGMVAHTSASIIKWNGEVVVKFENGAMQLKSSSTGNEMWDMGKNRKAISRFVERFASLRESTSPGFLKERYEAFGAMLTPRDEDVLLLPPPTAREKAKDVLAMFNPVAGYYITPLLLIANIIYFIVMLANGSSLMNPSTDVLIRWGANYTPATLGGAWWRLLSNVFIHIGVIHLVMNMYALLFIGAMLEPRIGSLRFGVAYLMTGVFASLTSLWWHPLTLSAGASGAIFGMYGLFLAMLTTNLIEKEARKSLLSSIGIFVLYNLAFGMRGGVDNAAHIGGLISGALIGYAYYFSLRRPDQPRLRAVAVIAVLVAGSALSVLAARNIHSDAAAYQDSLEKFSANESRFQEIARTADPQVPVTYIQALRNGVPLWEENLRIVRAADELDLPKEMRRRNGQLIEYADLRVQQLRIALEAAGGRQGLDSAQLAVDQRVNAVLESLNKE